MTVLDLSLKHQNTMDSADDQPVSHLNRQSMKKNTVWRHVMHLPPIPDTDIKINPALPLPTEIVDEQYKKIWDDKELLHMEQTITAKEEENIRNGIPTESMGKVATASMRWNKIVQAGMCTATYANDKFILQLTNSTLVAVLLSGFATAALVESPDFTAASVYPNPVPEILQCIYSASMLASAMYCFAATGIALHSVNRLSNVLPSKSSVAYMTLNIFFSARDSVNDYVFKGMAFACGGITTAFVWNNQNIYQGIPAAVVCVLGSSWFIAVYSKWEKMTVFHSDVGDKLCAKDMVLAAKEGKSMTEGLWDV